MDGWENGIVLLAFALAGAFAFATKISIVAFTIVVLAGVVGHIMKRWNA